jgi:phytoene/squalene synthetase
MSDTTAALSGKSHRDENFPVASRLIAARHRGPILAFYGFVRAADDVADHATLSADEKVAAARWPRPPLWMAVAHPTLMRSRCGAFSASGVSRPSTPMTCSTRSGSTPASRAIRIGRICLAYCALSAMPVGRFVLDVHGEDRSTWSASDPLCAALQIINHLQDCGRDFRDLDRVYIPLDALAEHGAAVDDLGRPASSPGLRAAIVDLVGRTEVLLRDSAVFPTVIADTRLALEVAVIQSLAEKLATRLRRSDPLSERVHATKIEALAGATGGILRALWARRGPRRARGGEVLSR